MTFVQWTARANAVEQDGVLARVHWAESARRGNAEAAQQLIAPPYPVALDYLYRHAQSVHGRSGVSEFGVVPCTWPTMDAFVRLTQWNAAPHEIDAVFVLDGILCRAGRRDEPQPTPDAPKTPKSAPVSAWPTRKVSDA